jgi:hypothetical protein
MQELQAQTFSIYNQGRGKVIDCIDIIELRVYAKEASCRLKSAMYRNLSKNLFKYNHLEISQTHK